MASERAVGAELDTRRAGLEGVGRWLEQWGEAWDSFEIEPEEYIDAGDKVVEFLRVTATGKGSGVRIERQDALEAAGLE
jgi:hypothetical protein